MTYNTGHTFFDALNAVSTPADFNFGNTFVACLVANIAFYSTWALNIPDLSRFAKSQKHNLKARRLECSHLW